MMDVNKIEGQHIERAIEKARAARRELTAHDINAARAKAAHHGQGAWVTLSDKSKQKKG